MTEPEELSFSKQFMNEWRQSNFWGKIGMVLGSIFMMAIMFGLVYLVHLQILAENPGP